MRKHSANPVNAWRTATLVLLLGVAALCAATPAMAGRKIKVPKEGRRSDMKAIESMEEQWRAAIMSGDATAMDKLLSEDFLAISARGTLSDKQQYLQRITTRATQFTSFDLMDLKVRVQPGSAVAVSQAHIVGVLESRPIQGTFRYTKVYGRVPGGTWRMMNFEATRVSAEASGVSDMGPGMPLADQRDRHSGKRDNTTGP